MQMDNKGKACENKIKTFYFALWNRREANGHKGGLSSLKKSSWEEKDLSIIMPDMYEGYS